MHMSVSTCAARPELCLAPFLSFHLSNRYPGQCSSNPSVQMSRGLRRLVPLGYHTDLGEMRKSTAKSLETVSVTSMVNDFMCTVWLKPAILASKPASPTSKPTSLTSKPASLTSKWLPKIYAECRM